MKHKNINEFTKKVTSYEGILGIHDLQMHSYGPSCIFATCHVEIDSKMDVLKSHDLIDNIEKDFDISREFAAYIRLKSCQKKQARVSAKINRLKKYYKKPTELFARFVEGLYLNHDMIKNLAPHTYNKFFYLLNIGYYNELKNISYYFNPKSL